MINTILATKKEMSQTFLADGSRIPVTKIQAGPCIVTQIITENSDGQVIQIGFGKKKKKSLSKPIAGHLKKVIDKTDSAPRYLREIKTEKELELAVGDIITADKIIKPGDLVNITGISRGKGFTGVMKRWGFKGGPRTHGQSDRQRAPGSIGQTTTPGRVFKGKKMPGRSGNAKVTVRNLLVVDVKENGEVWIKGQVPGARNGLLKINKVKSTDKFEGLYSEKSENSEKIEKNKSKEKKNKEQAKK